MTGLKFPRFSCLCAPKTASNRAPPYPAGDEVVVKAAPSIPNASKASRPLPDTLRPPNEAMRALSQDFAELRHGVLAFIDDFMQLEEAAAALGDAQGAADLSALLQAAHPRPNDPRSPDSAEAALSLNRAPPPLGGDQPRTRLRSKSIWGAKRLLLLLLLQGKD